MKLRYYAKKVEALKLPQALLVIQQHDSMYGTQIVSLECVEEYESKVFIVVWIRKHSYPYMEQELEDGLRKLGVY